MSSQVKIWVEVHSSESTTWELQDVTNPCINGGTGAIDEEILDLIAGNRSVLGYYDLSVLTDTVPDIGYHSP